MENSNTKKEPTQPPVQKPSTTYEKNSDNAKETSHREPPKPPRTEE